MTPDEIITAAELRDEMRQELLTLREENARLRDVALDVTAHLEAAVSELKRHRHAVPLMDDYRRTIERARAALSPKAEDKGDD